ncbi:ABC transporter substrate-binding protein [Thalassotalea insulae]|nr:ABC transporter substrate-binding protein [Thalassotalea insulae]
MLIYLSTVMGVLSQQLPPINLAVSNAISGPASQLGTRLNQGAQAYFSRVNQNGGIAGREINLLIRDDGYEPYRTLKNTQYFLKQENIFAFFNYVGTPTTHAILPLIKKSQLPFLMPFTGAEFLRTPVIDNIFNLRASYYQEAQAQIDYLVNERKITDIGLLVQADEFGAAVEQGYLIAMKAHHIKPSIVTRYRRNTQDISLALEFLKKQNVAAVAFVGTYQPLAKLINMAHQQQFTPFFTTVSFVSSNDLFSRINQPSRLLVTEVMPAPYQCQWSLCRLFISDMNKQGVTELDHVQLEGYLNAYVVTEVLKYCQHTLTSECFLTQLTNFQLLSPELEIRFSEQEHQGMDKVYLNIFDKQKYANTH